MQSKKVWKGSASPENTRKSWAPQIQANKPHAKAGDEQLRTTLAKEAALVSLEKNLGMIEPTAWEVGVTSKTIRKLIRKDASFAQSVGDLRASSLDFVESKMLEAIKQWKPGAAQLVMF